ncbi:nitrophenyl compound nitroreductase subunit ArsF family protein [Methylicorpusculum sp.]|uniref:nitrophenyl compound nitroreductase subunit ArsF family protein n=1 Tax=Methylicorpusculum sp. TaxID=2713644 RepID=UPI0027312BA5|nr:nitrophenyl compound nitroreductase subunit ArsF family protein [Methylicorpusculum sp.]MDP2179359.1 nitrophenyl compound nitroreductase subunit ArsF family protein [Methylicorpusculum sp.]MDP3529484.1 nitrophenyl compound nitroreductase subunit ArsF family protein [Methylicorpusculum sp.]MDZ4152818.1 nitrophenyl compound nitroreductase subunit ArsF family protein [Methylicorpusculum sp.]
MKKLFPLAGLLALLVCSSAFAQAVAQSGQKLDVYYFHSQRRCPTCLAIEKEPRRVLDDSFKAEMGAGVLKLTVLNLEKEESQPLAKKFEIWGSSLLLVNAQGQMINLSPMAFATARKQPEPFREQLEAAIRQQLSASTASPMPEAAGVSGADAQPQ